MAGSGIPPRDQPPHFDRQVLQGGLSDGKTTALNSPAQIMIGQGGKRWFFVSADYSFGKSLEQDAAASISQVGGEVVGSVRYAFPQTSDFSSHLLQAQASGAQVIGLVMSGSDAVNCVKQAAEFGIVQSGQKIAGLALLITSIHAIGLQMAQGLILSVPFYWNLNDGTRAFSRRFAAERGGAMPKMNHAGAYASTLHYRKAVKVIGLAAAKAKQQFVDRDTFGAIFRG